MLGEERTPDSPPTASGGEPTSGAAPPVNSGNITPTPTDAATPRVPMPPVPTPEPTPPNADAGSVDGPPDAQVAAEPDAGFPLCSTCECRADNGSQYAFCGPQMGATEAQTICESGGAQLVRVDSAVENAFLVSTAVSLGWRSLWTGGNDLDVYREWRWPDGEVFWLGGVDGASVGGLFSAWGATDPNDFNGVGERCVMLNALGQWLDTQCARAHEFVCER